MHVGIANPRWRGKCSRHSRRMRNPQFCVSGKRPIGTILINHIVLRTQADADWSFYNRPIYFDLKLMLIVIMVFLHYVVKAMFFLWWYEMVIKFEFMQLADNSHCDFYSSRWNCELIRHSSAGSVIYTILTASVLASLMVLRHQQTWWCLESKTCF